MCGYLVVTSKPNRRHDNQQRDTKTIDLLHPDQTFRTTLSRQTISLYYDTDQQTNLATHKPTQEKIKHPTAQKNEFLPPHKWHIWLCPAHKPTLLQSQKSHFFPTHQRQ
jgi:hypothetical protein